MSKYVIELRPDCKVVQQICESDGKVYVGSVGVHYLEELNSDYINENFGDLQDQAYQKGFEDGKAVNDKGCEGCKFEGNPNDNPCKCCMNGYPNQWIAKSDKIEVGDEVIYNGTTKCIVVRPEDDERYASLIGSDGTHYSAYHRECKKTGRHFDIASILEEMKHD